MTALPPGGHAIIDDEWLDDAGRRYRCIESENRSVGNVRVYADCLQWDDGTIDMDNENCRNRPRIALDHLDEDRGWTDTGITLDATEARILAALLEAAALQLDRWVQR